jgi:Tfp pilus assembly protein PilX
MEGRMNRSRGFTLIACLLLLLLLSGLSIALMSSVHTETTASFGDSQNGIAYHAAEGAIEKMTSDVSVEFKSLQAPQASDICNLSNNLPTNIAGINYPVYQVTPATGCLGKLTGAYNQIQSGSNQGLFAQIIPINLSSSAQTTQGQTVSMSRQVEVALIPVFQFGVYSDSDLSFFAGPNMDFQGRVHTNGDLYLAAGTGGTTIFHDKITAYGNVVRDQMANTLDNATYAHSGSVAILTTSSGCDTSGPGTANCRYLQMTPKNEGSTVKGPNPSTGNQNTAWPTTISLSTYNSWIVDGNYGNPGGTGAVVLSLPFVNGTTATATPGNGPWPYEIIRRPPAGESTSSEVSQSRLYNEANIRILLSDDPAELSASGAADPENVRLANYSDAENGDNYTNGFPTSAAATMPALGGGDAYTTMFATATTGMPDYSQWSSTKNTVPSDWPYFPTAPLASYVTLHNPGGPAAPPLVVQLLGGSAGNQGGGGTLCTGVTGTYLKTSPPTCPGFPYFTFTAAPAPSSWNLIDGYLRVEYVDAGGATHPVTREWLGLGFARGLTPPTAPGTNPISPNAILLLQEPADRNENGSIDLGAAGSVSAGTGCTGTPQKCTFTVKQTTPSEVVQDATLAALATPITSYWYGDQKAATPSLTQMNWYPINFYDAREGEARGTTQANASCTPMGIMNAVEIDVGNLQQWLLGNTGLNGKNVDNKTFNGYILYFSDRRGMLPDPNPNPPVDVAGVKTGDSGFEDVVNANVQLGTPDGNLEPTPVNKVLSPEDVNENNALDTFGTNNLGLGFGYIGGKSVNSLINSGAVDDPFLTAAGRIQPGPGPANSCSIGQKNWVSGARHTLRLVDGSLGNVPLPGFTVAAENPVYVMGNYNSSAADPMWLGDPKTTLEPSHSAASIIADAVSLISNDWSDIVSFQNPTQEANRKVVNKSYYRMAIAAGKNINFPCPGYATPAAGSSGDFGTDGGVHNFLRYLENWNNVDLYYKGSLVSMYYATYATGTFKDGVAYSPPTRHYIFDPLFSQAANLPPGTPLFRDIDNLSYRQSFTPQ